MSDVRLRPMTAEEYETWLPESRESYAHDMIVSGGIDEELARAKAVQDFETYLPDGVETEGHWLYAVEDDGEVAGSLWLAERDAQTGRELFVYEVRVAEARRGRGLGRAAMVFAEEEARRRGLPHVSLNVFGGNDVARGLYRSLGYTETAVFMRKAV